jgi:peptide/nickel transport system substrate-binding protein
MMSRILGASLVGMLSVWIVAGASIAQTPQRGGTLIFSVTGQPDTYDCHATPSVAAMHRLSPHYSLLIRIDPETYPAIAGDVAESWTVSPDQLTYTFRLHRNVVFHDGTPLTAADVKATFERLRNPPPGVVSLRKALFEDIAAIDTPDPATVIFRLSRPNAAFLTILAGPFNCLYSARQLAADPSFPIRNVMGSGPFRFVEQVAGSHWVGRRFEQYFVEGRPYLDGFRAIDLAGPSLVNALIAGQTMADFRGLGPGERDRIVAARGEAVRIVESPWVAMLTLTFNTRRRPFDDVRVRRALTLAIDRWAGAVPLARLTFFATVGGFLRPGYALARSDDELTAFPGFARDIAASRTEARRLLAEAGVANLSFTFANRSVYTPQGIFLIDQWRQIGVTVRQELLENTAYFAARRDGNFEVIADASNEYVDEPSIQLAQYLSVDRAPGNISGATDRTLDALFDRQARAIDPAERRAAVRDFEARLLEQAYSVPFLWSRRIVPLAAAVQGYVVTPSYYLAQDLSAVWLRQQ